MDGRTYPWGGKFDASLCNVFETGTGTTTAVGMFPGGASPYGVLDMSGNVWEWTATQYGSKSEPGDFEFDKRSSMLLQEYRMGNTAKELIQELGELLKKNRDHHPILRGGSWNFNSDVCRCVFRYDDGPYSRYYYIGFRCART